MSATLADSQHTAFDFIRTSNLIGFARLRPDGVFVEANDAYLKIIGYTREEVIGKMSFRAITAPEFVDISVQTQQLVQQSGISQPFEKDYLRKDGKRVTVLVGSVRVGGSTDVCGFILDITQRKADERALAQAYKMLGTSEARFRRLMDANVIGVGFFHIDGRFLDANDALLNLAGVTRAELEAGQFRWDHLTPPEYRHLDERAVEELRTTGKCSPYEKEYLLRDGRRMPVVIAAAFMEETPDEGFCFVLDNSARRAAEKALLEAHRSLMETEERFRLAVFQCPDIMYFQDADLRFTWMSRALPPRRVEDVLGKTDLEFHPPEQARRLMDAKRRVMQTRKGERVQGRAEVEGKLAYFETALEPRIDGGKVIGVAGYLRNMTAWREKEMELSQANASLEQMRQTLEERVAVRTAELARSESRLRQSEEHQRKIAEHNQRLVHEVEHRVRNNLSGLVALVNEMRDKFTSVDSFADAIEGRLRAMAHVHQVLAAAGWSSVGLRSLVESTLHSLSYVSPHECDIVLDGLSVEIGAPQALPLTLILAEWFTNSCKYGACSVKAGKLRVAWSVADRIGDGPAPRRWLTLAWTEQGGPPIRHPITPSLGTNLVQGFASQELQGECELNYPPEGARHTLRFPV